MMFWSFPLREVKDLFPLADVDSVLAGFYTPSDGRINPVDVTMAIAKGARMKGVRIFQNTPVRQCTQQAGRGDRGKN